MDRAKKLGLIFWIITKHVLSAIKHPFYLMINLIKLWIAQKIVYVFLIATWVPITYQCPIKTFITLTECEINLLVLFRFYNLLPINKFRNHKFCCVGKILLHKVVNSYFSFLFMVWLFLVLIKESIYSNSKCRRFMQQINTIFD